MITICLLINTVINSDKKPDTMVHTVLFLLGIFTFVFGFWLLNCTELCHFQYLFLRAAIAQFPSLNGKIPSSCTYCIGAFWIKCILPNIPPRVCAYHLDHAFHACMQSTLLQLSILLAEITFCHIGEITSLTEYSGKKKKKNYQCNKKNYMQKDKKDKNKSITLALCIIKLRYTWQNIGVNNNWNQVALMCRCWMSYNKAVL